MIRFQILLLLASCATVPAPVCVTPCGLELLTAGATAWSCPALAEAEAASIEAFDAHVTDVRFRNACALLKGWRLVIMPGADWVDPYKRNVSGETNCDSWLVQVGERPPLQSSLPHELAHVIQRCMPTPFEGSLPESQAAHANWDRDGINAAIDSVGR